LANLSRLSGTNGKIQNENSKMIKSARGKKGMTLAEISFMLRGRTR
jgi:hypothetical protein